MNKNKKRISFKDDVLRENRNNERNEAINEEVNPISEEDKSIKEDNSWDEENDSIEEEKIVIQKYEEKLLKFILDDPNQCHNFNDSHFSDFSYNFEKYIKDIKLITNIQKYDFESFWNENLNKIKIGSFILNQEEILTYSDIFINSLTNLDKKDINLSRKIHSHLYNYLIKAANINEIKEYLGKIIKIGLLNKNMKMEIILQFIKFSNIKEKNLKIKAIQGLNILLNFIKIDNRFVYNILNYWYNKILIENKVINESENKILDLYKYCFVNIIENMNKNNRLIWPSNEQIQNLIVFEKIEVKVYISDMKYMLTYCELYTTIKELKEKIFNQFDWKPEDFNKYCLIEVFENCFKTEEIIVEDFIRISDILGSWNHEIDTNKYFIEKTNKENNRLNFSHKLYFRKRYYNIKLEYSDVIFNYLENLRFINDKRIKLESHHFVNFIIIYLKINYCKYENINEMEIEYIIDELKNLEENEFLFFEYKKKSLKLFREEYSDYQKFLDLILNFNKKLSNYNAYLCQFYNTSLPKEIACKYEDLPLNFIISINPKDIFIMNNSYSILRTISYNSIKNIFINDDYLFINYSIINLNNNEIVSLVLFSFNSSIIMKTIENYINLIIGNALSENYQNKEQIKNDDFDENLINSEEKYFKNVNIFYK